MLIDESNNYEYFCHKYKVSNIIKIKLKDLHKAFLNHQNDKDYFTKNLKKNIFYHGKEKLKELNIIVFFIFKEINFKDYLKISENIGKIKIPKFPYDGNYLLSKNLIEGKKMGLALETLKKVWVDNNYTLTKEQETEIINKLKN